MKKTIISILNKLPYIRGLYNEIQFLKKNSLYSPTHFYSTIISVEDIKLREKEIWKETNSNEIIGVNFNDENQIKLILDLEKFILNYQIGKKSQISIDITIIILTSVIPMQ